MTDAGPKGVRQASLRMMAARIIAQQRWPYISSLLFTLRLVPVTSGEFDTMAVDEGWRLYYAPSFVLGEEPDALATVLIHEAMHCLHQHAVRYKVLHQPDERRLLWNLAADAAINSVLESASMPWPTVEPVLYQHLEPYGVTDGMVTETAFFAMAADLERQPAHRTMWRDCGSGASAGHRPYELSGGDASHPALAIDQQDTIRDRVAHEVITHAKHAGNVPAGLLRWAEDRYSPRIPWRDVLASRLRRDLATVSGRRDYTYSRPSRRQQAVSAAGSTVLLPAMRQPAPPRVAVVLDTSGSISADELSMFLGEVFGITRATGISTPLGVICCDAEAYPPQRVRSRTDVAGIKLEGGGGTDMRVGIATAAASQPRPHIIVVFTDGYTPWPEDHPRNVDSVVVVLSAAAEEATVPNWATTFVIDPH